MPSNLSILHSTAGITDNRTGVHADVRRVEGKVFPLRLLDQQRIGLNTAVASSLPAASLNVKRMYGSPTCRPGYVAIASSTCVISNMAASA